jgi:hypothetical protein
MPCGKFHYHGFWVFLLKYHIMIPFLVGIVCLDVITLLFSTRRFSLRISSFHFIRGCLSFGGRFNKISFGGPLMHRLIYWKKNGISDVVFILIYIKRFCKIFWCIHFGSLLSSEGGHIDSHLVLVDMNVSTPNQPNFSSHSQAEDRLEWEKLSVDKVKNVIDV